MKTVKIFIAALLMFFAVSFSVHADPLPAGTLLTIDAGDCGDGSDSCIGPVFPGTGSYFGMDTSSYQGFYLWTPLFPGSDGGLILGQTQQAAGSHAGPPDGTETAPIDAPWSFFGNTGMHWTSLPVVDFGDGTVDMSGWQVTWNELLQGWDHDPCYMRYDDLLGNLTVDLETKRYILEYDTDIPCGCACFGGTPYLVHLEGSIQFPPAITGFWPGDGTAWDFIFVFGSGFVEDQTSVQVNGLDAMGVYVLDEDVLIFMLPYGDTTGPITVTTPSDTATSANDFGVSLTGPQITGIWPGQGQPWDFVFVFGAGFVEDQTQVQLNGTDAMGVFVLDESVLIFMVPFGATTGPITVTTPTESVTSVEDFVVIP